MKAIIKGLRYDTETATKLEQWWSGLPASDFRHATEVLYRTPRGNYFIYGSGGPMSRWGESTGDMRGFGAGIKPLTYEGAAQWCESHDFVATIEEHFQDYFKDA